MKIKNLLVVIFLLFVSSFSFSQEQPNAIEDTYIVRCNYTQTSLDANVWQSVFIGSPFLRKNISIVYDSTSSSGSMRLAFKNSYGIPDTSTGYYFVGTGIKQWRNRNSDYLWFKGTAIGSFWINIEYTNGPSLEYGGLDRNQVINLIGSTPGSDTNQYVKKYGDFTKENNLTIVGKVILDTIIGSSSSGTTDNILLINTDNLLYNNRISLLNDVGGINLYSEDQIELSATDSISLTGNTKVQNRLTVRDSLHFKVLTSLSGYARMYTRQANDREFRIENVSADDSSRIQLSMDTDGGIILNGYGKVTVGSSGSPMRNDSIMFKFGRGSGDATPNKYTVGFMTQSTNDAVNSGIGVITPTSSDSIIFVGLNSIGKYNFIGNFYQYSADAYFDRRIRVDTALNLNGAFTIDDTTTITGRLNVKQEFFGRDVFTGEDRYLIASANESGTAGVAINAVDDKILRIRDASVSSYASVMLNRLMIDDDANKSSGSARLVGGTVTVSNTSITTNSIILMSPIGITNAGFLGITKNAGVGFTIDSSNASDVRVIDYVIVEKF